MTQEEFRRQLTSAAPDMPAHFHNRVEMTLERIVKQEDDMNESTKQALRTGGRISRRALILALILVLALAAAAAAATQWHVFDQLSFLTGTAQPKHADALMQANLYQQTVNGVEITVREAGYDGRTLFLQYSYRMTDVDTAFGSNGVPEEAQTLLDQHNVGWWCDCLWFNGQPINMPDGSGSMMNGSDVAGEIIETEYWFISKEDVSLSGPVQITLPIGERPDDAYCSSLYDKSAHSYALPDRGVVTFTFDAKDALEQVAVEHPNQPIQLQYGSAMVSDATFTPLLTYVNLELDADSNAWERFIAEHGSGVTDENGSLLWTYSKADLFDEWLLSLALVDGSGAVLFPEAAGMEGYNDEYAEFIYPHIEELPEALWLAPIVDDTADMTQAVRVH